MGCFSLITPLFVVWSFIRTENVILFLGACWITPLLHMGSVSDLLLLCIILCIISRTTYLWRIYHCFIILLPNNCISKQRYCKCWRNTFNNNMVVWSGGMVKKLSYENVLFVLHTLSLMLSFLIPEENSRFIVSLLV